ncbi:anhydro-N-acetylmuramic acid kinase [Falsibacillus albus]|uniref:Anhydro-N-acetylmuramic acid kinase n=2 Tax=Falsibacillus albus TaxID=2478915 RepID=A0A3L7K0L5_9BACI|nr:anhydro-N-acetylmuramic acid kinase [Falsibacillus albus]
MEKIVVGLMSGTSVDGIDAAIVKIKGYGMDSKVDLLHFSTMPFEETLKREILDSMDIDLSNAASICSLNFKLGKKFADAVRHVCTEAGVPLDVIDLIGSHGQTIYHIPNGSDLYTKSTLQIGEAAVIAHETNTMVVSGFRAMDMAAGGEGAPLVPYTECILYNDPKKNRALQNIGGIGNVTVLPKGMNLGNVFAFDTGPGNMVMDELSLRLKGSPYDPNGQWAAAGIVDEEMVAEWLRMDFFSKAPPKSTGRELFGKGFTDAFLRDHGHKPAEDLIATATYFTAASIAKSYQSFIFPKLKIDQVIIGGGGSYNSTLMTMLRKLMPDVDIGTQEDIGFSSEAKEAIAFAVLANETIHQQAVNVPRVTGASSSVILGNITLPPGGDHKKILQKAGK